MSILVDTEHKNEITNNEFDNKEISIRRNYSEVFKNDKLETE